MPAGSTGRRPCSSSKALGSEYSRRIHATRAGRSPDVRSHSRRSSSSAAPRLGVVMSPSSGRCSTAYVAAGAPGVLVAVREDGKVRSEARGFADRNRSIPMRADQRFRVGSITKTFVAALVLLLVEDRMLRLDDTVERWLPGLVPGGRAITVRDLLSHTTGLFDYVEDDRVLRNHERRWTPRELVSIAVAHAPERSPAGAELRVFEHELSRAWTDRGGGWRRATRPSAPGASVRAAGSSQNELCHW